MSMKPLDPEEIRERNEKLKRSYEKQAPRYDKGMKVFERWVLGDDHRAWACNRASGDTLEVGVGTALNLAHYPKHVRLTGIDLSADMLAIARGRAVEVGRDVDLREGDAHTLPFPDSSFDTVVCTYALCNIPDQALAISEMERVLRPGGKLILVDHIRSAIKPVLWFQKAIEFFSLRFAGDHMTRRPLEYVKAQGFEVIERNRLGPGGVVERLVALKQG